jgi:hypothetical protein
LSTKVNLVTSAVAPEVQTGVFATIPHGTQVLGNYHGFKHGAPGRMRRKLVRCLDTHQESSQPGIMKVQLRRLDQALTNVGKVWGQAEDDVTGLKNAEPCVGRTLGNTAIVGKGENVQYLCGSGRT